MNTRQPTNWTAKTLTLGQALELCYEKGRYASGYSSSLIYFISQIALLGSQRSDAIKEQFGPSRLMSSTRRFRCCLVGGTFDRFHAGHRLLLNAASKDADAVEIHIASDSMAEVKSPFVQSFEDRMDELYSWAQTLHGCKVSVHQLNDNYGPARHHSTADAIVATPETIGMCKSINEQRAEGGLAPLHIIEVMHLDGVEGGIISSSAIRNGHMDPDGHPWIPKRLRENRLKMAAALDVELKTPMGELFEGPEDDPEIGMTAALDGLPSPHGAIITVGDVTTKTMLDMGFTPDIALIDGQTKRTELQEDLKVNPRLFHHHIHAENPAGFLTPSLNKAIAKALLAEDTLVLEVDGEEDLAPLVIHCLAPIGTVVLYGQPKKGVVVQYTTLEVKQRCRFLLSLFEVA